MPCTGDLLGHRSVSAGHPAAPMSHAEQLFDSVNKQAAAAAALERQNQPTRADRWFENRRRLLESYRSKNANEKPSRGESPAAYAKSA